MLTTYLFDIGNVILRFDYGRTLAALAPRMRCRPEEAHARLTDLVEPFETGRLSADDFLTEAVSRIEFQGSPEEFRTAFEDIFERNDPMVRVIESISARGQPLFLLSNTNPIHIPYVKRRYDSVFSLFHGAVYSHEAGCMKPDPEIYRIAIETYDLDPRTTLYIDDLEANCEAGREAGFPTIHYHPDDHDGFLAQWEGLAY